MTKAHHVTNARVSGGRLYLTIDGTDCVFSLAGISQRLAAATEAERSIFEIASSGYGIHWPLLDEDLSIDGLLGVVHKLPPMKQPA